MTGGELGKKFFEACDLTYKSLSPEEKAKFAHKREFRDFMAKSLQYRIVKEEVLKQAFYLKEKTESILRELQ